MKYKEPTKKILLRVPDSILKKIDQIISKQNVSRTDWIQSALDLKLKKETQK